MFTRGSRRLIIRGNKKGIPLDDDEAIKVRDDYYRFSGHTHTGLEDVDLIASGGDEYALELFKQNNSAIYNAMGRYSLIYPKEE
jgi:hypothetical protein